MMATRCGSTRGGFASKSTVDVEDQVGPPEGGLIGVDNRQATAGKAVDRKGRKTKGVQLALPEFNVGRKPAGTVHQDDGRKTFRSRLRNAQLAGERRWCSCIGRTREKLLVAQG